MMKNRIIPPSPSIRINYERWPDSNPDFHRPIPQDRRLFVLQRDGYKCVYCERPAKDIDHVLPITKGGMHHILNMVACCKSCNSSKGDRTPDEWQSHRFTIVGYCQEGDNPVSLSN